MSGWTDGWTDERTYERGWMSGRTDGWTDKRTYERGCMSGRTDGRVDWRADVRMIWGIRWISWRAEGRRAGRHVYLVAFLLIGDCFSSIFSADGFAFLLSLMNNVSTRPSPSLCHRNTARICANTWIDLRIINESLRVKAWKLRAVHNRLDYELIRSSIDYRLILERFKPLLKYSR